MSLARLEFLEDNICDYYDNFLDDELFRADLLEGVPPRLATPALERVMCAMRTHGHSIDDKGGRTLNIVGLRSPVRKAGQFDDWICVFWRSFGQWQFRAYPATTDPGRKYLLAPLEKVDHKGTAILKAGQYKRCYSIGKHGSYTALVQVGRVAVHRDNNRDKYLDLTSNVERSWKTGINIHRAHSKKLKWEVGDYSAGCQVFQDPREFVQFMRIVRRFRRTYGNRFTYTLIDMTWG